MTARRAHAAANPPLPAFGVQFHGGWSNYTDTERASILDKIAASGSTWVRVDVGWCSIEFEGNGKITKWYVDVIDKVVDLALARKLKVLGTLWCTPPWANGGQAMGVSPTNIGEYADAAKWAATRWAGRISAWEVWNEPNHPRFWTNGDPVTYAALLKIAYPAFKLGDPGAQVVLGGPVYNDTPWLEKVYKAGARGFFDIMSTHPYQAIGDTEPEAADDGTIWRLTHTPSVRDLMVRYGDGDKPIWFTEFGWSSHDNPAGTANWQRGVTEAQQADYLVRSVELIRAKYPYVSHVFWYNEKERTDDTEHMAGYGLMESNGAPKPAYNALKNLYAGGGSSSSTGSAATTPSVAPKPAAPLAPLPENDMVVAQSAVSSKVGTVLYFAEGYTGAGFHEYLTIFNPGSGPAKVDVTYQFSSGAPMTKTYPVGARSRTTVDVNAAVGAGKEVSIHIEADRAIAAERPMYFSYNGDIEGGSVATGVAAASKTWYFAEGHVGNGFDEYLTFANPTNSPVTAEVTYQFRSGSPLRKTYTVGAKARRTVFVNDEVSAGDVSVSVAAAAPIIAERPLYFRYQGTYTGGSSAPGAAHPTTQWYFAEGYTAAGYDEYITIQNPNPAPAEVEVRFRFPSGDEDSTRLTVPAHGRSTVSVNEEVGSGREVAAVVVSNRPVVAERPMYVDFDGIRSGSTTLGLPAPTTGRVFAEGFTGAGFDEFLTVQNPGDAPAKVSIRYAFTDGTSKTVPVTVAARARATVHVNSVVGDGREVAVEIASEAPVVVERPMYFKFRGIAGATVSIGMGNER